jgi:hypothetical protein
MPLRTILIIVLVLLLIGAFPVWPYSSAWGYYPSGGLRRGLVAQAAPSRWAAIAPSA